MSDLIHECINQKHNLHPVYSFLEPSFLEPSFLEPGFLEPSFHIVPDREVNSIQLESFLHRWQNQVKNQE